MGSTFLSLHYHIVFATKHRKLWIANSWRDRLYEYLGGTIQGLNGVPQAIGGVEDHVHLLVGLRATYTLADFVREVKKSSSTWIHDEKLESEFFWQEGYSAFTVSPPARAAVRRYIRNQQKHHRRRSFIEELTSMLEEAEIAFDPQYLD
jgi:putative transposase